MSATPLYLLAKYIPDLQRYEPRNIGVVIWSPEGVAARFVGEKSDQSGEVDGRSVPGFITSLSTYKQWVRYWRESLAVQEYLPPCGGAKVNVSSAEFVAAFKASGSSNFLLAEGGYLLDGVSAEELPVLVNQLFDKLVESSTPEEARDVTLEEVCEELFEQSKLDQHPYFRRGYSVPCPLDGAEEVHVFSHAVANGKPERLFQSFSMPRRKTDQRKTVHDAAWAFEKVQAANIVTRQQTAALVHLSNEQLAEPDVERALLVLKSVTNIINLTERAKVLAVFEGLAKLPVHADAK